MKKILTRKILVEEHPCWDFRIIATNLQKREIFEITKECIVFTVKQTRICVYNPEAAAKLKSSEIDLSSNHQFLLVTEFHDWLTWERTILSKIQCIRYYALWIIIDPSLTVARVTKAFDIFAIWRGYPAEIRVDNGKKINFHHTVAWAEKQTVKIKYIQPGKPAENGFIECFDRTD